MSGPHLVRNGSTDDGDTSETGSCYVSVNRLRHEAGLFMYPDMWHLSRQQVDAWNDGKLDVFEMSIGWDRDMGGPA
ncbi:hypothetical protein DKT69_23390 [Micromonospora sicca]|uniref:Uncharacterized protein n=1 Tax=Micromonospora sicca TaxID=2202420 RepID=A0A317DD84_9ACTN|nr:hypothetical protein [Micromonospora sp. 4G51]PWR12617.1 hypothetical protein DKT69_23390 [Micromonospora sp. 4G51]